MLERRLGTSLLALLVLIYIVQLPRLIRSYSIEISFIRRFHSKSVQASRPIHKAGIQLNAAGDAGAYIAGASTLVGLIPASVVVDSYLQDGTKRIETIANTKFTDELGDIYAYVARPSSAGSDKKKKYPTVFLIHQFFGLRKRDTELCDELARLGYVAVAPDCFQGNTTGVIPRAISFVAGAAYKDDWVLPLRDMRRVVQSVEKNCPWADTSNMVVAGFCFGGGLALRYADKYPSGVYGDRDRQFPPAMVDVLETLLKGAGVSVEMRRYEGKAHAFVEDLECINKGGDAGDAWGGFVDFLRLKLSS
jgi:carboxymethylenebutenolidase